MKRVSVKDRREQDNKKGKGVDALFEPSKKQEAKSDKQEVAKVTLYIRPDQVLALEHIQLAERKRTGARRDKSSLIQEAIDLLIKKYNLPNS